MPLDMMPLPQPTSNTVAWGAMYFLRVSRIRRNLLMSAYLLYSMVRVLVAHQPLVDLLILTRKGLHIVPVINIFDRLLTQRRPQVPILAQFRQSRRKLLFQSI